MPFKQAKQMNWAFANKPKMAREWVDKYHEGKKPNYKKQLEARRQAR